MSNNEPEHRREQNMLGGKNRILKLHVNKALQLIFYNIIFRQTNKTQVLRAPARMYNVMYNDVIMIFLTE